jgi:prophage regulatory protein
VRNSVGLTTLANSTRWKLEKDGQFPKRIKIGATAVAYSLSEVQAWIRGEWFI